jgi:hypothetical protein
LLGTPSRCRFPRTVAALVSLALLAALSGGCVVVPQTRRKYLADPTMQGDSELEARAKRKQHTSREGAGGGDGQPAGGGCGCGN